MPAPRNHDDQPRCDECGEWAEWHDETQTYLCDFCERLWEEDHPLGATIQPVPAELVERIRNLVGDIDVDLDAPIDDDEEESRDAA